MSEPKVVNGTLLEESEELSLAELSRVSGQTREWLILLVEEGVIEPCSTEAENWRFTRHCLQRVRIVQRLESDLGVNLAGAALAVELLEELDALRRRIEHLEG